MDCQFTWVAYSAKKLTFSFNFLTDILNRFLFAEVFDNSNNINFFNSTERKGVSFICILYCCNFGVSSAFHYWFYCRTRHPLRLCGLMLKRGHNQYCACIYRIRVHHHTPNSNLGHISYYTSCTLTPPHINFLFYFFCVQQLISENAMWTFDLIPDNRFVVCLKLIIKLYLEYKYDAWNQITINRKSRLSNWHCLLYTLTYLIK